MRSRVRWIWKNWPVVCSGSWHCKWDLGSKWCVLAEPEHHCFSLHKSRFPYPTVLFAVCPPGAIGSCWTVQIQDRMCVLPIDSFPLSPWHCWIGYFIKWRFIGTSEISVQKRSETLLPVPIWVKISQCYPRSMMQFVLHEIRFLRFNKNGFYVHILTNKCVKKICIYVVVHSC